MTYIHKTLGLALLAVCAFGAVLASDASAAEFTAFNTTTSMHEGGTVTGTDLEPPVVSPGSEAVQIKCLENSYKESSATGTEPTPIVVPAYGNCSAYLFGGKVGSAVVETHDCRFQLHIANGSFDAWTGTMSLVCPAGVLGIHFETSTKCTMVILAANNTAVNGFTYTNNTAASPTDVVVDLNATNVHSTTSGGFFACGVADGTHTAGTLKGKITLRAYNSIGQQIDYTVM
jgi:hypothetical protein